MGVFQVFNGASIGQTEATRMRPAVIPALMHAATGRLGRAALCWDAAAIAPPYADVEPELAAIEIDMSAFDRARLDRCGLGSFGYTCAAFAAANGLRPLRLTGPLNTTDPARKLAIRRILLHDALHVLLDLRADAAGELGVFSFVAAQRYSPVFEHAASDLAHFYAMAAPWLREDFEAAARYGRELAEVAPRLLTMPLEREWDASLAKLQARLKLRRLRKLPPMQWPDAPTAGDSPA